MIQPKKKPCNGEACNGSLQYIWKTQGKQKYCKSCWWKIKGSSAEVTIAHVKQPAKTLAKRKMIAPVSNKMQKLLQGYRRLRRLFFQESKNCTCQARLHELYPESGVRCMEDATDVHHKKGRGIYLLDISTWIAVCRECHSWIEENPIKAKELGLSESRLNEVFYDKEENVIPLMDLTLPEELMDSLESSEDYSEFGEQCDGAA